MQNHSFSDISTSPWIYLPIIPADPVAAALTYSVGVWDVYQRVRFNLHF